MMNLLFIGLIAIPGALVIDNIPQRQPLLPPELELTIRVVWNPVVWSELGSQQRIRNIVFRQIVLQQTIDSYWMTRSC